MFAVRSVLILVILAQIAFAQHPVMATESALSLGKGKIETSLGAEYLRKNVPPPPDFPQSVLRVFVVALHFGVADKVNFDLDWLGGLSANFENGARKFDWGDLTISTKINLFRGSDSAPAVAVRTSVKLPSTSYYPARLGSNEMDFHTQLLLSKQFSAIETRLNLRFSIVGDPEVAGVQDDIYGFDAAALLPVVDGLRCFAELRGFSGYEEHDSKLLSRLGFFYEAGGFSYGIYSSLRVAGDNRDYGNSFEASQNWSIGFAITKSFTTTLFE